LVDPQAGTSSNPGIDFSASLQADCTPGGVVVIIILYDFLIDIILFFLILPLV
jgi:hypothetical protein